MRPWFWFGSLPQCERVAQMPLLCISVPLVYASAIAPNLKAAVVGMDQVPGGFSAGPHRAISLNCR